MHINVEYTRDKKYDNSYCITLRVGGLDRIAIFNTNYNCFYRKNKGETPYINISEIKDFSSEIEKIVDVKRDYGSKQDQITLLLDEGDTDKLLQIEDFLMELKRTIEKKYVQFIEEQEEISRIKSRFDLGKKPGETYIEVWEFDNKQNKFTC